MKRLPVAGKAIRWSDPNKVASIGATASLPFDDQCAEEYGLLRDELDRAGTPIGPNDLLIAATARAHGVVLVTHNVREFSRVPELRTEDWESDAE